MRKDKEKLEENREEKKKGGKISRKKVLVLLAGLCVLLAAGIGSVVFFQMKNKNDEDRMDTPPAMKGMEEDIISASGLTTVGMVEETWELDFLETPLYVEESYLSTGDEVEAGTAVFKVSQDTLEEAREELKNAVTEAELNYRQGLIDYETGLIDARVTNETAAVNKKYSQAEYDNSVAQAAETVESLEEQIEEAEELVEEYTKSVNEDYYRTYYKVDELYQAYYDHFNLLMDTYEKWDIENLESAGAGSSVSSATGNSGAAASRGGNMGESSQGEGTDLLSVYNMLDEMVQEEAEKYQTALENYETAKRTAEAGLEQAQSNLASLEAELVTAQTEYDKQLITCKADYEITLAESDNAGTVYETTLESLEETLESLKNDKEEAEENLALFEEVIGDGYFYTQKAGTIVMNGVIAESYLSGEIPVVAYSDPETVCVSASVDQSNIAEISVGDSAYVVVNEYGNYQGKVTQINPVTQAQSRSSVTYQVTVTLEGDVSALDSNLTAYVYFGVTDEMMQHTKGMSKTEGGEKGENAPETDNSERAGEKRGAEEGRQKGEEQEQ